MWNETLHSSVQNEFCSNINSHQFLVLSLVLSLELVTLKRISNIYWGKNSLRRRAINTRKDKARKVSLYDKPGNLIEGI